MIKATPSGCSQEGRGSVFSFEYKKDRGAVLISRVFQGLPGPVRKTGKVTPPKVPAWQAALVAGMKNTATVIILV